MGVQAGSLRTSPVAAKPAARTPTPPPPTPPRKGEGSNLHGPHSPGPFTSPASCKRPISPLDMPSSSASTSSVWVAQLRRRPGRPALGADQHRRRAGDRIVEAAGLGGAAEDRVGREQRLVRCGFGERAVGRPADAFGLERGRQLCLRARRERRLEQRIEPVAMLVAHGLMAGERDAELGLQRRDRRLQLERLDDRAPLPRRDRHHHQPAAIPDLEVAPERGEDVVAQPRPVGGPEPSPRPACRSWRARWRRCPRAGCAPRSPCRSGGARARPRPATAPRRRR